MPEGDSVARLSRRLQPLVGRTIEHSDFRVPRLATVDHTGTVITRVWPHGKHLFWACGDLVLHTHLRMEGNWRIHPVGTRWSAPALLQEPSRRAMQQSRPAFPFHSAPFLFTIQKRCSKLLFSIEKIFSYVLYKTYCCCAECLLYSLPICSALSPSKTAAAGTPRPVPEPAAMPDPLLHS